MLNVFAIEVAAVLFTGMGLEMGMVMMDCVITDHCADIGVAGLLQDASSSRSFDAFAHSRSPRHHSPACPLRLNVKRRHVLPQTGKHGKATESYIYLTYPRYLTRTYMYEATLGMCSTSTYAPRSVRTTVPPYPPISSTLEPRRHCYLHSDRDR